MSEKWDLIFSDAERYVEYGGFRPFRRNLSGKIRILMSAIIANNHSLAFTVWLRFLQSDSYTPPYKQLFNFRPSSLFKVYAYFKHRSLRRKFGLQIPPTAKIGPGFYIGHGFGIIINGKTKIGAHCSMSHFVSIGSTKQTPATIGDNVYIGPGVCIVEDVKIGDNVKIGAGTVVIHDIPDNSTSVGNPNRIIQR